MGPLRDEEARLAHALGLELLDDHLVEERAKDVGHARDDSRGRQRQKRAGAVRTSEKRPSRLRSVRLRTSSSRPCGTSPRRARPARAARGGRGRSTRTRSAARAGARPAGGAGAVDPRLSCVIVTSTSSGTSRPKRSSTLRPRRRAPTKRNAGLDRRAARRRRGPGDRRGRLGRGGGADGGVGGGITHASPTSIRCPRAISTLPHGELGPVRGLARQPPRGVAEPERLARRADVPARTGRSTGRSSSTPAARRSSAAPGRRPRRSGGRSSGT